MQPLAEGAATAAARDGTGGRCDGGPVVWFHTFGCKANQYDTERMRQELETRGARVEDESGAAEVAVVNTCTVTSSAETEARRLIRRLKRDNPQLRIVVAGCSAALRGATYLAMDEVDAVVGGQDPVAVATAAWPRTRQPTPRRRTVASADLLTMNRRGTRAWLKVQDGCDRKCSFCATRLARGTSRSRPIREVVREARLLARRHPEIVITGIHIGHYGRDLDPPASLARLIGRLLEQLPGIRVRLTSIEATEIDDDLLELLEVSGGALAPHLHLPLQSGSDAVLRRMRRWHTREAYRARVIEIAGRLPRLGLGADVIVGFPGETETDHAATRALIGELPYTYLHVFPYSTRAETAASSLPGRVPDRVVARRGRELREMAIAKGDAYRRRRIGERARVVLEGSDRVVQGLTGDYLRVEVEGTGLRPGTLVDARLRSAPEPGSGAGAASGPLSARARPDGGGAQPRAGGTRLVASVSGLPA